MNADDFNKIAGATIGAFLVFLLLNFFAGQIYGTGEGGHHEETLAFAVELEPVEGDAQEEEATIDYAALLTSADAAAGEKVFNKCKACHKIEDGANAVGPHLWGIVGRDIASIDGYGYSEVLAEKEGDWTLEELSAFLEKPSAYAKGTKMSFGGLKKPEDRVNVIVYMNEADGTPEPLE